MCGVYEIISSPLGKVFVAEIDHKLCFLSFHQSKTCAIKDLLKAYPAVNFVEDHITNAKSIASILHGLTTTENIPISEHLFERCSGFRKSVYNQLMRIPRGKTRTYSEVAKMMGRPRAYRAVAQACAANVLAVVIPCHRVIASDGSIGGYTGGVEIKHQLLTMELKSTIL